VWSNGFTHILGRAFLRTAPGGMAKTWKQTTCYKKISPYISLKNVLALASSVALFIHFKGWAVARFQEFFNLNAGLAYYSMPSIVIANATTLPHLHIYFDKRKINEASTAQIAIWNQGHESIRLKNVVDPIRIVTHPKVRILTATIVKSYRPFVKVNAILDTLRKECFFVLGHFGERRWRCYWTNLRRSPEH
jgi:hypothetical protein